MSTRRTAWSLLQEDGPDPIDLVGAKIAEFALRSLATLAQRNPRLTIEGRVPVLGTHLDIRCTGDPSLCLLQIESHRDIHSIVNDVFDTLHSS